MTKADVNQISEGLATTLTRGDNNRREVAHVVSTYLQEFRTRRRRRKLTVLGSGLTAAGVTMVYFLFCLLSYASPHKELPPFWEGVSPANHPYIATFLLLGAAVVGLAFAVNSAVDE